MDYGSDARVELADIITLEGVQAALREVWPEGATGYDDIKRLFEGGNPPHSTTS